MPTKTLSLPESVSVALSWPGSFLGGGHVWSRRSFLPIACWFATVLLISSGIRAQTPALTVEQAYAAAISFAPADLEPTTTLGRDSSGAIVWSSTPYGAWGYRNDSSGRTLEAVDELGNRSLFSRDHSGRLMEVRNEYSNAGTWTERFVWDAEGLPFLRAVETGPTDVARKLSVLGITEGLTPMAEEPVITEDTSGTTWFFSNFFASATFWRTANLETVPDGVPYLGETTYALGLQLSAWMEMAPEGIWIRDDHGGARLQTYDTESRLVSAEDASGTIVSVERDAEGRPTNLYIGEVALLRYTYGAGGAWTKELIDRRTGEVVYAVDSAAASGDSYQWPQESVYRPRPVTQALLAGYAPVVEWDSVFPWDGHVLANLSGEPYALLPIGSELPSWRSITPLADWPARERIDYSADQVVIHVATDADGPDGSLQTVAITLPRRPSPEPPFFTDPQIAFALEVCNTNCICITRSVKAGIYVEVRCPRDVLQIDPRGRNRGDGGPRLPDNRPRDLGRGGQLTEGQRAAQARGRIRAKMSFDNYPACRDLFKDYAKPHNDGQWVLDNIFVSNGEGLRDEDGRIPCSERVAGRPVSAWARTRGRNVYLCKAFETLGANDAAIRLIHESLHIAGLGENPPDPGAMTAPEINALVKQKCQL